MNKRNFAAPRIAAGVLVAVALFSAACGNDSVSRMTSPQPQLNSSAISGVSAFKGPSAAVLASAPSLGTAANFVVLGGAGVTCTASHVTGVVGSKLTVTNNPPPCSIIGAIHQGDATAVNAFNDFSTAYTNFNALTCDPANTLTGQPLGGMRLAPGVYCFPNTTADLTTGTLTLAGPASGIWVFQIGTAITTGTAEVVLTGGAQACNVYWVLGKAATIGTDTRFRGTILAGSAVTFTGANSSLVGRALAKTAVTMTGTTITGCAAGNGNGNGDGHGRDHDKGHRGHHRGHHGNGHDRDDDRDRGHDDHNDRDHEKNSR
jgi:hypothetical protein